MALIIGREAAVSLHGLRGEAIVMIHAQAYRLHGELKLALWNSDSMRPKFDGLGDRIGEWNVFIIAWSDSASGRSLSLCLTCAESSNMDCDICAAVGFFDKPVREPVGGCLVLVVAGLTIHDEGR